MLRKAPGFTAAAVLILALGVGANAAVFSLVNAALLRPVIPGMRHTDLVGVYAGDRTRPDFFRLFSYAEFDALRRHTDTFAGLLAEGWMRAGLTEDGQTQPIEGMFVSSNYFSTLRLAPALGRGFTAEEAHPRSGALVAVVSDTFWRTHGSPTDIIGRRLLINGQSITVVGVAPAAFHGTLPVVGVDLWLPLGAARLVNPAPESGSERAPSLMLAGILAPGISIEAANARLAPLAGTIAAADLEASSELRLVVHARSRTGRAPGPRSDAGSALGAAVLMTIAGMVLFVACLNLANMLLARGGSRRQEIAVRLALGGSRARVVRQLMIEGLILSALGSTAAVAVSWWAAERFLTSLRAVAPMPIALDVSPDARVAAIVAVAAIAGTLIFSLGPAWRLSKPSLATAMKAVPASASRARRIPLPSILVGSQIALSLALLVAAGAFMRSSHRALSREPGFPFPGGLVAELDAALIGLDETQARAAYRAVLDRVRTVPGVADASLATVVPFGNDREAQLVRGDRGGATSAPVLTTLTIVTDRYFATVGLPLIQGREFTAAEERNATAQVAIVDRVLAEQLFGRENPIGRVVHRVNWDGSAGESPQIVGVVPTVRDDVMTATERPHLYLPLSGNDRRHMMVHVKVAAGTEAMMIERVRRAIHDVNERLPVVSFRTLDQHRDVSTSLVGTIFAARVFSTFGAIGLLLASLGVYGLRAYLVTQRTREIGIRVALGATRSGIVRQLLTEGARTAGAGLIVGVLVAIGVVQLLRRSGMLFEAGLIDPMVFALAAAILGAATTAASYLPARRALRIDPAVALRPE